MSKKSIEKKYHDVTKKIRKLSEEIYSEQGKVNSERLRQIKELKEVQALLAKRLPAKESRIIRMFIALLVALLVITMMLTRVTSSDITFYGHLSSIQMTVANPTRLFEPIRVDWVSIENYDRVFLPSRQDLQSGNRGKRIIKWYGVDNNPLQLSLPVLPRGSTIEIIAHPNHYELAVCGLSKAVVVKAISPSTINTGEYMRIDTPKVVTGLFIPIHAPPSPNGDEAKGYSAADCSSQTAMRIVFSSQKDKHVELNPDTALQAINFYRMRRTQSGALIPRSTLIDGTLIMNSVGDKTIPLRRNDYVELNVSQGEIQSLTLKDGTIRMHLVATVSEARKGKPNQNKSIMPHWIEWWLSQELIFVAWSLGVSIFGFVFAVRRWLFS